MIISYFGSCRTSGVSDFSTAADIGRAGGTPEQSVRLSRCSSFSIPHQHARVLPCAPAPLSRPCSRHSHCGMLSVIVIHVISIVIVIGIHTAQKSRRVGFGALHSIVEFTLATWNSHAPHSHCGMLPVWCSNSNSNIIQITRTYLLIDFLRLTCRTLGVS